MAQPSKLDAAAFLPAGFADAPERVEPPHERIEYEACVRAMGLPRELRASILRGRDEHGYELRETAADEALRSAVDAGRRIVVLVGPAGTAKTYAAARWLTSPIRHHYTTHLPATGRFYTATDFCALKPWGGEAEACAHVQRLVLDDIGLEDARHRQRVEQLIHARHANGLWTVCTTNYAERLNEYSARTASRIGEVGRLCVVSEVVRPKGSKKR